ncbi:hypothetical protein [Helicobacter anatolicus]|uniref:hypothetical protein n=1 Tax=Helicobacter anatolicus TaxID=2905874 RepID=UPI001E351D4A|nr:hypothetical protein [Helicobacter anatolicus]MCE3037950.1 hypothetical protein [Helicobacter anatolicus]
MIKKGLILGCSLLCLWGENLDFEIKPFGALGGLYNQGLGSSHSYGNVMAHVGADFVLENGWKFGIGAIGGWNVFNKSKTSYGDINYSGIGDKGDISEVYAHYKNSRLEFALGRFNTDFVDFEYLSGNIQGASAQVKVENISYWGIFMDSLLLTGAHKNTSSTLYGTNIIGSYYPTSKKNILGKWGEVFAVGFNYANEQFKASVFTLLNTQVPANVLPDRKGILFQVGGDAQYKANINEEWFFVSTLRGIFQLGNTEKLNGALIGAKDSIAGLVWFDQLFRYRIFEFGLGVYGVIGSEKNGGIYTFSDPSRFYGKIINNPLEFASPYFTSNNITGYVFGSIDLSKNKNLPLKLDGMVSFGNYTEYSIVLDYNAWSSGNMKINTGIGYVYSKSRELALSGLTPTYVNNDTSSLIIFGKFFY